ncbi:MAG: hypothetical protein A3J83_06655 [Elusimicrobia bacterium RIFOXYA2_FULL_40_6]|nr:MAG: hypothetical protein A3J83_06655 [Elusimicrobia bacterium RIFOXYA2_FULL_40_6]
MDEIKQTDVLKRFTSGVFHKIRNSLGIINTSVQYCLAYPNGKEKVKDHLENVAKYIKNIEKTLECIDAFSRPLQLNLKPLLVKEFLDKLYYMIEDKCRYQEVKLTEKYRHISSQITADSDYLEEALLNFIINSLEAMPNGGMLSMELSVSSNKEDVIIKIVDTGPGILDRHLNEIFDPFFTTNENRVGLGLSIAQRIIDAHKGRIEVNSDLGKGTVVRVYLPLLKPGK